MRISGLLVLCCLGAASAQDDAAKLVTEGGVVVLNDKNFDTALKLYDVMLVEFYAPWCGFCKQLKPEYEASAKELASEDFPITLAKSDVIKEEKLGERFKVESFPTLKVFLNHEPTPIKWEGDPSKKNVLEKMRALRKDVKFAPPMKKVNDVGDAKSFAKGFANVLGIFASESDPAYKAFAKASVFQAHREFVNFGVSTSADVAQHFGVEMPAVLVLKQFDDAQDAAPEGVLKDVTALEKWVQAHTRPIICPLTDSKTDCGMLTPMYAIFVPGDDASVAAGKEYAAFHKVAKASRDEGLDLHFGFMDADHQAVEKFFELYPEELPTVAGLVRGGQFKGGAVKFHVDKNEYEDINEKSITEIRDLFLKSARFEADGMDPSLASADPVDDADSPLKTLVSSEWVSRVTGQKEHDTMVEFYAPWCSMCKTIAPYYEELAKMFEKVPSVLIAKIDATANEVYQKGIQIEGYPTIYWIPASTHKAEVFDKWSNKDLAEMQKWIEDKVSIPIDKALIGKPSKVTEAASGEPEKNTKSEAGASQAAEDDASQLVKTLVLSNFKERVLDDESNWFVDFHAPWCGHCKTLAPKFEETAKLYQQGGGKGVVFAKLDPTANDIPSVLPGFEVTSFPSIYFFGKDAPTEPVEYKGPKYKEEMLEFVNGGYKTAAVSQLKSAEAVDDSSLPVKVLVGKTFKERVLDSGKNSLMEFYAPWCGHCKALAPKLDKIGEAMAGKVFIGKMDLTANELPKKYAGLVQGYPTLLYFPHDDPKNPLTYAGPREEKDIVKYLEEQAKADEDDADDL
jgi:protein disulfide-isomerase-like protein